eukprot:CAMPEP_0202469092 /NCGR_PEP_ID=MMETSP1360-20130828/77437_1 /ASSEMBLY_ACC=CAM_ASM_000848 /TAXON_ID=515479 /ORGANISM="Licmophora paradoxa, Strain CCMP2313" /LENGTH=143 /DNA_ID=CAMNT_0049094303 /DNA_START=46 /DNA_END=477 /DNA_ORIENTATION=-
MTTDHSSSFENIHQKVKLQYQHIEEYCNAQTRLRHAMIEEDRELQGSLCHECIDQLQRIVQKIQKDQSDLSSMVSLIMNERQQAALSEHIARSERVLETILRSGGMFYTDGIPSSSDDVGMKTVALSTLWASSNKLQRQLGLR